MIWDVMEGDTDASKIGEVDAIDENSAYNAAIVKYGSKYLQDLEEDGDYAGCNTYISVRIPYGVRFPNAKESALKEKISKFNSPDRINIFSSLDDFYRELLKEISYLRCFLDSQALPEVFLKDNDFSGSNPEQIVYWEDVQKLLMGVRLCNMIYNTGNGGFRPPTVFAFHIKTLQMANSEQLLWWNTSEKRQEQIDLLKMIVISATKR